MIDNKELLKLEQDILSIYGDGNPFNNHQVFMAAGLKSLLGKRKYLIDTGIRESSSIMDLGLADELFQFNNSLNTVAACGISSITNYSAMMTFALHRLFRTNSSI